MNRFTRLFSSCATAAALAVIVTALTASPVLACGGCGGGYGGGMYGGGYGGGWGGYGGGWGGYGGGWGGYGGYGWGGYGGYPGYAYGGGYTPGGYYFGGYMPFGGGMYGGNYSNTPIYAYGNGGSYAGGNYPGYSPSLTYSSAYYAPTTTATSPGYQSQQTTNTAEANAAPPGFQATGRFYEAPNTNRRYPIYREIATGREVYFPNQR